MNAEQMQMGVFVARSAGYGIKEFAQAFYDWSSLNGIKKTQGTRALVLQSLAERLKTAVGQEKVELLERQKAIATNWISDDARARVINARVQKRVARREGRED